MTSRCFRFLPLSWRAGMTTLFCKPEDRPMSTEPTACGEQHLLPGVQPLSLRDRLQHLAAMPLLPRRPQKRCDIGLFDEAARAQLDLFLHTQG